MTLLTNIDKREARDVEDIIRISGLKGEIRKEAYTLLGDPLPDHYSVWYEQGTPEQTKAVSAFFHCNSVLKEELKRLYLSSGVPEEMLKGKVLYRGCEREYFPQFDVSYPGKE